MRNTAVDRDFYEAKWVATDYSRGNLRNWLVRKERFFLRHLARKRGCTLDLGCGGGWLLYTCNGPVFGVDISYGSLNAAARIYQGVALAGLTALPFASDSFDLVVSTDVLGHVAQADKVIVWSEISRVLRPGGHTVHYVEADGDDPMMSFAKRRPDLYQRYIVGPEGHIGLESVSRIRQRFRALGFRPVAELPAYRALMYVRRFVQYFDNEYAKGAMGIRLLVACCKALVRARLELPANLVLSVLLEVGDRILPESWSGGLLVCYQKPFTQASD